MHAARLGFDLDHAIDRPVEEVAIVRDEHDARGEPAEKALEPRQPGEVEVVRRLVEEEHVEASEQDRGERRPRCLSAGEAPQLAVGAAAEPDVVEHRSGAGVEVLAAEREVAIECIRVGGRKLVLVREPPGQVVHLLLGGADPGTPREVAADGLAGTGLELLRQVADRAGADHTSGVRCLEAREHAQQGRFADAVRADDADPVAGGDDERHAVQHLDGGIALRDVTCCQ